MHNDSQISFGAPASVTVKYESDGRLNEIHFHASHMTMRGFTQLDDYCPSRHPWLSVERDISFTVVTKPREVTTEIICGPTKEEVDYAQSLAIAVRSFVESAERCLRNWEKHPDMTAAVAKLGSAYKYLDALDDKLSGFTKASGHSAATTS